MQLICSISVFFPVNMKAELRKKYNISFDILDLKSFKRSAPNHGWAYIIFILKDGTTFPALHFHSGGSKALLQKFGKYIHIKRYRCWFIYSTHTLKRCRSRTSTEGDAIPWFYNCFFLVCFRIYFELHLYMHNYTLIVVNMLCWQCVFYCLFSLQRHRVYGKEHKNNPQNPRIIKPRGTTLALKFLDPSLHCYNYTHMWRGENHLRNLKDN